MSGHHRFSKAAAPSARTSAPFAQNLAQPLLWAGFRPLSDAEAHAAPFARSEREQHFVRLDADALHVAILHDLQGEQDLVRFLEHQELDSWGYDLNLGCHADRTTRIHELHFVISRDERVIAAELTWLGYRLQWRSWRHPVEAARVPDPGPDFKAPIFPALGWVRLPGSTGDFDTAERRHGFCTTTVPAGAQSIPDVRGYRFVYAGYREKSVTRQRIITIVDPVLKPSALPALVESAIALTYGQD